MTTDSTQRTRRILLLVAAVAALLLVAQRLALGGAIERCIAYFRAAGAWPFFLAMAVLPVFGFPILPFTVAAGPVFAPTMGVGTVIGYALLAEIVNMAVCYWLAARALRPWVERLLAWLGCVMPTIPAGSAWEIVLLVRIVPGVPFFLQNYILGLARVPFGIYLSISFLVHAGLVIGTILAGDALARRDPWTLAAGLLFLTIAGVAIFRLRKRWTKSTVGGESGRTARSPGNRAEEQPDKPGL